MKKFLFIAFLAFFSFCARETPAPVPNAAAFDCSLVCGEGADGEIFGRINEIDDNVELITNIGSGNIWEHPELTVHFSESDGVIWFCSSCGDIIDGNAVLSDCENGPGLDLGQPTSTAGDCLEFTPPAAFWKLIDSECSDIVFTLQIDCK